MQIIFSAMFIEQKHGWSDILSGMPIFGIRESKKRVVEYILGLDTLKNEKEKELLNDEKAAIEKISRRRHILSLAMSSMFRLSLVCFRKRNLSVCAF